MRHHGHAIIESVNPSPGYPQSVIKSPPAAVSGAGVFISTLDAAELLACTPRTVVRLITAGHLPATRLGPGRTSYRISADELHAFTTRYGHHSPSDVAATAHLDELPPFTPQAVMLTTERTPDGLLLVRPAPSPGQG